MKPTPEPVYLNRRRFLIGLGLGAAAAAAGCAPGLETPSGPEQALDAWKRLYPAARNPRYTLDRPLTDEAAAGRYNNFYEFGADKGAVGRLARRFPWYPWQVEVTGLVAHPKVWDIDELVQTMPLEERLYRHRCVEAWAMAVPWTGFPLKALIEKAGPLSAARYVRLVSFHRPALAPGQAMQDWYPWPYYEALRLDEAMHELTLLATGIYGHPLPMQHGAPIRLVTPWKYGFKSIKSIARIELVDRQPPSFWNDVAPAEYGLEANVDPAVPHPRWSQAMERLIDTGQLVPTAPFNGYGELVAGLYV